MLHESESVTFIRDGKKYSGVVLGCEKEHFWLLVFELKSVYVGHPDRIFLDKGKRYFEVYDRSRTTDELFNPHGGQLSQSLFEYSSNPERIMQLLTTYRMAGQA